MTDRVEIGPLAATDVAFLLSDGRPDRETRVDAAGISVPGGRVIRWPEVERILLSLTSVRKFPRAIVPVWWVVAALSGVGNSAGVIASTVDTLEVYVVHQNDVIICNFRPRGRVTRPQRDALDDVVACLNDPNARAEVLSNPAQALAERLNRVSK